MDAMRWFVQDEVISVYSSCRLRTDLEFEGTIVILKFKNGALLR